MKIAWYSSAIFATSGYGLQSKEIVFRLVDEGYNIISIGDHAPQGYVYGGHILLRTYKGNLVHCYPCVQANLGMYINYYVKKLKPDVLIVFYDPFPHLNALKKIDIPQLFYVPIDGPVTERTIEPIKHGFRVIAYSKFGYNQLLKFLPPSKVRFIYHGIDCNLYKPLKEDEKLEARRESGVPEDAVVFLTVNANIGVRKMLPLQMEAFSYLAKEYDDVYLYMHTNGAEWPTGFNLVFFAKKFGIENRVIFPDRDPCIDPLEEEEMVKLFGMADWYVNTSESEGFGLGILQSLAVGVPVIVANNSSQTELGEGCGLLIDCVPEDVYKDYILYVPYHTWYPVPSIKSIYQRMKEAYLMVKEDQKKYKRLCKNARRKALNFDWKKIIPRWKILLEEVEEDLRILKELK